MKTTKEDRDKMRDFYGDIRLQRADCRVIMALDDLEAAEAEVKRLREVLGQCQENESIVLSKEDYDYFVAECAKPGEEPSEELKKLADNYKGTVTSLEQSDADFRYFACVHEPRDGALRDRQCGVSKKGGRVMCLMCGYHDCACDEGTREKSTDIPRSALPPLPEHWRGPWEADGMHVVGDKTYRVYCPAMDYEGARFLAALLNVTHPAPGRKEGG